MHARTLAARTHAVGRSDVSILRVGVQASAVQMQQGAWESDGGGHPLPCYLPHLEQAEVGTAAAQAINCLIAD